MIFHLINIFIAVVVHQVMRPVRYLKRKLKLKALGSCDLGDGYSAKVRQYPHKDMLPELTKVIDYATYDQALAEIERLKARVDELGKQLMEVV